jgi:hypothetical protein
MTTTLQVRRHRKMMRELQTREICQVTDVTEEDFETTEGESVDLYDKLMVMTAWTVTACDNLCFVGKSFEP